MTSILDRPLAEIAAALRSGESSAEELATFAIARHDRFGAALGAYQVWRPDKVLDQARDSDRERRDGAHLRPLGAIPVSIKDLFGVRGYPTYAGTVRQLPEEWEREGPLVRALQHEAVLVMGKTRMVELAFGGLGTNPHWGTPVNPWDPATPRVPGGSSSGAGVSIQEGSALVALGTDTACSVRVPAAWTGSVGLKTTKGRWPKDGFVPLSSTLDSIGILTRSVADACYAFSAIDAAHGDPEQFLADLGSVAVSGLRIGVVATRVWDESSTDIAAVVRSALAELEANGARLADLDFPEFDRACDLYSTGGIAASECRAFVERSLPGWLDLLDETVGSRIRDAAYPRADEFQAALRQRQELIAAARGRWLDFDILVTPTVTFTAPRLAEVEALEDYMRLNRLTSRATNPVNLLDLCALTLPCGLDAAGIPVGLQCVARAGEEQRLLAASLAIEGVLGTAIERIGRPPLCS